MSITRSEVRNSGIKDASSSVDNEGSNKFDLPTYLGLKNSTSCCDKLESKNTIILEQLLEVNRNYVKINKLIKQQDCKNTMLKIMVELNDDEPIILSNEIIKTIDELKKINECSDEMRDFEKEIQKKIETNRLKRFLTYFQLIIPILGTTLTSYLQVNKDTINNKELIGTFNKIGTKVSNTINGSISNYIHNFLVSGATSLTLVSKSLLGADELKILPLDSVLDNSRDDDEKLEEILLPKEKDKFHNVYREIMSTKVLNLGLKRVEIPSLEYMYNTLKTCIRSFLLLTTILITLEVYSNNEILQPILKSMDIDMGEMITGGSKKRKHKQKKTTKYYNKIILNSLIQCIKKKRK